MNPFGANRAVEEFVKNATYNDMLRFWKYAPSDDSILNGNEYVYFVWEMVAKRNELRKERVK